MTTFAQQLKPLLEPLGDTREAQIARAAAICGVSPRTIYLWLAGQGNPNAASKAGTLALLAAAGKSNK